LIRDLSKRESYADLPLNDACRDGLFRYVNDGLPPSDGSFLRALLENDLMEAFGRADDNHMWTMRGTVAWLFAYLPASLWGTKHRVAQHCARTLQEAAVAAAGMAPEACPKCHHRTLVPLEFSPETREPCGKPRAFDNVIVNGPDGPATVCAICGARADADAEHQASDNRATPGELAAAYMAHVSKLLGENK
jgi:hypothetical protein